MMGTDLLSLCVFVLNFFFYIKYYFFKGGREGKEERRKDRWIERVLI